MYAVIWRYKVRPQAIDEFEQAYGPQGDWVRLFKLDKGFMNSELLRSTQEPDAFVTIDRWVSRDHFMAFLQRLGDAYAALDARMAGLTLMEMRLGDMESDFIGGPEAGLFR
jgi:heme-degrading monooxygenase HmoA